MIAGCERNVNHTSGHRMWAAVALVLAVATVIFAVDVALSRIPKGFSVAACVALAVVVAAVGLVHRGAMRIIALAVAVLLLAGAITLVFVEHDPKDDVLIVAGVLATLAAARLAFRVRVEWPRAQRPAHPVLFYNPLSGGGKAERFALADEALQRGGYPGSQGMLGRLLRHVPHLIRNIHKILISKSYITCYVKSATGPGRDN